MKADIKHLAKLSKLHIDSEQEQKFETQMQSIIEMVEKLPPIEGSGALLDENNPMECRKDEVSCDFKRDDILKNAPQVKAGCVVVPKIIE